GEAGELGGVADACDGIDGRVDLRLVCFQFALGEGAGVGGLHHEGLDGIEQVVHFAEGRLGCGDDRAGAFTVLDSLFGAADVRADALGDDESGRVVLAAIDAQTGREPLEADVKFALGPFEVGPCDETGYVRVDSGHDNPP